MKPKKRREKMPNSKDDPRNGSVVPRKDKRWGIYSVDDRGTPLNRREHEGMVSADLLISTND